MKKTNQSGRTMLEMLGVLAIMGIITYGAIAGINYGMSSYKINQTYSDVQNIIQGIEDLYSWSKLYPPNGEKAESGDYPGCPKIIAAACENDVLRDCTKHTGSDESCSGRGAFSRIFIEVDGDGRNFKVRVPIVDATERTRVEDMDWAGVNIAHETYENGIRFWPK